VKISIRHLKSLNSNQSCNIQGSRLLMAGTTLRFGKIASGRMKSQEDLGSDPEELPHQLVNNLQQGGECWRESSGL
jgi:hypothetical protein